MNADASDAPSSKRWSGRRKPTQSRRDDILRGVGAVLRNSASSALTMQSIAEELGITKGNLYYYFRDKQDILFHCHMRSVELSLVALRETNAAAGGAEECLRRLLVRHIQNILDNSLSNVLLTDLESLTPAQRTSYVVKRDEFEAGVRALIETGVRNGEFYCNDVKLAGLAILGAANWTSKWYRPDGAKSSATIAAEMAAFLTRSLLRTATDPRPRRSPSGPTPTNRLRRKRQ